MSPLAPPLLLNTTPTPSPSQPLNMFGPPLSDGMTRSPFLKSSVGGNIRRRIKHQKGGEGGSVTRVSVKGGTEIARSLVLSFDGNNGWLNITPEALTAAFNKGDLTVNTISEKDVPPPSTTINPESNLAIADAAVKIPAVMENLMKSVDEYSTKLARRSNPTASTITTSLDCYNKLKRLFNKVTAPDVIREILVRKGLDQKTLDKITDTKILEVLGWHFSENRLLYDVTKIPNGGISSGLFSLFNYSRGKLSNFLRIEKCGKDYVCMLNWLLLVGFHLNYEDNNKYPYEEIHKLIINIHNSFLGFLELEHSTLLDSFVNGNTGLYKTRVTAILNSRVFASTTENYQKILEGIKGELQDNLTEKHPPHVQTQHPPHVQNPRPSHVQTPRLQVEPLIRGGRNKYNTRRLLPREHRPNNNNHHHTIKKHSKKKHSKIDIISKQTTRKHREHIHQQIKTTRSNRASDSV
jgi:predicted CopG family antitoxin